MVGMILGLMIILGGCGAMEKPPAKIDYYTLEYNTPVFSGLAALPWVIRLERFSVAPTYNTTKITYRDHSFKRAVYPYHEWRANPGDLVGFFLARDIRASGLFKAVLPHDSRVPASFLLEGSVDEFYERDGVDHWDAVLSIGITLMAENEPDITKRVLFQKSYRMTQPCEKKNPMALVEAMSLAMEKTTEAVIRDLYENLKQRP
jgi:cholesterol transport system auxiliary component